MLLFLLDALSSVGEAEAFIFLFNLLCLFIVPLVVLIAYYWYHLSKKPQPPRIRPLPSQDAGNGGLRLLLQVLATGLVVGLLALWLTK